MNLDDIRKIMEGSTIEFKEAIVESVFKTLSAFANTNGGIVYIGISDRKEIKGFHCQNSTIEDLTNKIVNKLGIHPQIDSIDVDDKNILKIETKKSTLPVSYDGRYYKRVGNTTREMQGEELRAFFIKGTNWDGLTGDYSVEEIDAETVRKFVRMAVRSGRLKKADEDDDIKTTLEKLKLVIDGKLTNGAIMLFGKIPQNRFINAVVRVGRFKDEITIIGDRYIEGNLFKQVDESLESIKNFINVRYEITGETLTRENIWDYPLEALRESLLNSVIHRDYFRYNVQTQIKVFDDKIWFFNIGGLPEGITLNQLKIPHPSVARNPLIVHVFYLAGLIEEYGSGIGRIMKSTSEAGIPEPEFKEEFGGFSVYLYKNIYSNEQLRWMGLNDRQVKAVNYVREKGKITNKEYRELTGLSDEGARLDFALLIEKGILLPKGSGRGALYVLK
jgi:ATP-dependent DNA helicase RecG